MTSTYIYYLFNSISQKGYVGKSKNPVERLKDHKKRNSSIISKAIRKYGLENFKLFVVWSGSESEVDSMEKFFIKLYRTFDGKRSGKYGYNQTAGGEGGDTSKSANWIKAQSEGKLKLSGSKNGMFGKVRKGETHNWSTEGTQKLKSAVSCRISCRNIEYSSIGDAEKALPGISIRKRLDSNKYPEFFRIGKKINRK